MSTPHSFLSVATGSFASPAAENPTIAMMEAAYRHHGLDVRYLNFDVAPDALGDAVRGARAMGWLGFNCSLPHKVAVVAHLDALAESARIIGAVNCVVRDGDRLIGENTDGKGFVESLAQTASIDGSRVLVIGAGGAARAIAVETALAGAAEVTIVNRSAERGRELADLVTSNTNAVGTYAGWHVPLTVPDRVGIVIDATSVGLYPDIEAVVPLDIRSLRPGQVVADVVPNPPRTRLLREAEALGCTTLDGLGMLVNQGAVAVRLWTGTVPDRSVMRDALEQALGVRPATRGRRRPPLP